MRSHLPILWILLFFVLLPAVSTAQSVTSYALPDTLSSGDTFDYVITSSYQSNQFTVIYPPSEAFSDTFEFRGVQRFKGISVQDSIVYRLQYFGVKDTVLTGLNVLFVQNNDTLRLDTAPVPIFFRSNLESESEELRPFKPIFDFARAWWVFILVVLLIALVVYLLWKYRNRFISPSPKPEPVVPVATPIFVSPFTVFEKSLKDLKVIQNYGSDDGFKNWHIELSDAIRTYIEHTHAVNALEMTTRETHQEMQKSNMHPDIVQLAHEILRQCDMVKFAKMSVDTHKSLLLLEKAEKLRDLFRFMDESRLKELKFQFEMKHGLRQEKMAMMSKNESENEELDDSNVGEGK